jgi:methyl-accepting chemotaxis protein
VTSSREQRQSIEQLVTSSREQRQSTEQLRQSIQLMATMVGVKWTRKTGQLAKLCSRLLNWLSEGASRSDLAMEKGTSRGYSFSVCW